LTVSRLPTRLTMRIAFALSGAGTPSRSRSSSASTCRACRWATSRSRISCKGATICRTAAPSSARVRAAEEGGSRSGATCGPRARSLLRRSGAP
jgi:hypothetical protein